VKLKIKINLIKKQKNNKKIKIKLKKIYPLSTHKPNKYNNGTTRAMSNDTTFVLWI